MARKLIIDCDPGIDDAVALSQALFDPRLEVLAVTAVGGNVPADQASENVQAIVNQLDPARTPRVGTATPPPAGHMVDARHIHGENGLANVSLPFSRHHQQHTAEKLICDLARAHPGEVTLLCLGPLTNAARALQRDPQLADDLDQLVIMGGSIQAGGNITPAAEFNIYCDPASAREVFLSPANKLLVPLDVTYQVLFSMELLSQLPSESSRAGWLLRKILPQMFRAYHELLGQERINLHDAVALLAVTEPGLFEQRAMAADVETTAGLSLGATVFDRRANQAWQNNIQVVRTVDATAAAQAILQALKQAGEKSS
jgi:purine nucleosidase